MLVLGFALAALIGLSLGLLGGGGSILTVPVFVYVLGFAAKPAIAMSLPVVGTTSLVGASLVVIAMNAASGFAGYAGRVQIEWPFVAAFTAVAIVGALVGAQLAKRVSATALRRGFAVFLVALGVLVVWQNRGAL